MGTYRVGPSRVRLTGHAAWAGPGEIVEHDFSLTGPDGEHGPGREAHLLACGALEVVVPTDTRTESADRSRRRTLATEKE